MFNSPQTISVIEFSPSNSLDFIQLDSCNKTSFAAKEIKAKAAINGSYFDISNCVPTTYINISGKEMSVDNPKESFRVNGILVIKDYKLEIHNIDSIAAMIEGCNNNYKIASSGPLLIENNKVQHYLDFSNFFQRHPRSAIALKNDDKIMFIVVDGRNSKNAAGITINEFSFLLKQLDCKSAINLDGGGSSTLWFSDIGIVNNPSDNMIFDKNGERNVVNLFISSNDPIH